MSKYNLKYKNCIASEGMVTFQFCPEDDKCGSDSDCSSGSIYSVDFPTFIDAFTEAQMEAREYACEFVRENCDDDEDTCYAAAGYDYCIDNEGDDDFNIQEYLECIEEDGYYVGPYCSEDDAYSIFLGVFTDEDCTTRADDDAAYQNEYGKVLSYSAETGTSIIADPCARCNEHALEEDKNGGDAEDEDNVLEQCEDLYEDSLKCEQDGDVENADASGCSYITEMEENEKAISSTKTSSVGGSAVKKSLLWIGLAIAILSCCGLAYFCYPKLMNRKEDPTKPESEAVAPGYDLM